MSFSLVGGSAGTLSFTISSIKARIFGYFGGVHPTVAFWKSKHLPEHDRVCRCKLSERMYGIEHFLPDIRMLL